MAEKSIIGVIGTLLTSAIIEVGYLFIQVHVMKAEIEHLKAAVKALSG